MALSTTSYDLSLTLVTILSVEDFCMMPYEKNVKSYGLSSSLLDLEICSPLFCITNRNSYLLLL